MFPPLTKYSYLFNQPSIQFLDYLLFRLQRVDIARKADNIFITKIREAGLYDQVSRATQTKTGAS
jgi:hypothetical protein